MTCGRSVSAKICYTGQLKEEDREAQMPRHMEPSQICTVMSDWSSGALFFANLYPVGPSC